MKKPLVLIFILMGILVFSRIVYSLDSIIYGKLVNNTGYSLQANISVYQNEAIANSSLTVDGNYSFSVTQGTYDLNYKIFDFISNFYVRLLSVDIVSDVKDKINNVTKYDLKISFTIDSNGENIQLYSEKKPNNISADGKNLTEVGSLSQLANNTWFFNSTENRLYVKINISTPVLNCSDGTLYGQCSFDKPKYCDNGNLIDRCSICNCSAGYTCLANESCNLTTRANYTITGVNGVYNGTENIPPYRNTSGSDAIIIINTVFGWMSSGASVEFIGNITISSTLIQPIKLSKEAILDFTRANIKAIGLNSSSPQIIPFTFSAKITLLGGNWEGTANDNIRIQDGASYSIINGGAFKNLKFQILGSTSYLKFLNCDFHDSTTEAYYVVFNSYRGNHSIFENCTFRNSTGGGILFSCDPGAEPCTSNNTVQGCTFDSLDFNPAYGAHAIYIDAAHYTGTPTCMGQNIIRGNTFRNQRTGAGVHVKCPDNKIYNNTFENFPASYAPVAISCYSDYPGANANNNEIFNNSFTNMWEAIRVGQAVSEAPQSGNKIYDNIFTNIDPNKVSGTISLNYGAAMYETNETWIYYNKFFSCPTPFPYYTADPSLVKGTVIAYNEFDIPVPTNEVTRLQSYGNTLIYGNGPELADYPVPLPPNLPIPPQ